ncbi:MAG: phosphonate C-P lyase system protein PhnH [Paracoccus sp. (in: a-proteobacteria)]|nr:phosphonate C-P lyase system protein PhnH [Paracoccus sp. (in: a-proteobacteria)]
MNAPRLTGGFADPAEDSARAFRAILEAMARPGMAQSVTGLAPPGGLSPAAAAALLVLCDPTAPLYLAPSHDLPELRAWITFQCGAPIVPAAEAAFALGAWDSLLPLEQFAQGTPEYPDRSATLIVDGGPACPARLTGPGIDGAREAALPDPEAMAANNARFPLGVDFILADGAALRAIPRSTRIEVLACM